MKKPTHICRYVKYAALALAVLCSHAYAQVACAPRDEVVNALKGRPHVEEKQWFGISRQQTLYELWLRKDGSWSILQTMPDGNSCMVAAGEQWAQPEKESH